MGPFDDLLYTAGDSVWKRLLGETKLEDAKSFFDVRFWGAFLVTKHGSKLIRPGGSIIFTSSTIPRRPSVGFAIGASISSAVEAFTPTTNYKIAICVFAQALRRLSWRMLQTRFCESFGVAAPIVRHQGGQPCWPSVGTHPLAKSMSRSGRRSEHPLSQVENILNV
jgi:hypothetical protein